MYVGFCVIMMILGFIIIFGVLDSLHTYVFNTTQKVLMTLGVAIVLINTTLLAGYLYTPKKIEEVIICPVHTIDGVNYIQYQHPDDDKPTIVNLNKKFHRSFTEEDSIAVTIYSEGPYNMLYARPACNIDIHVP